MQERLPVDLLGHEMELLGLGGIHWPSQRTLFVADTHFGKEATFRRASIPVPVGSTIGTVQRLSKMIAQCDPLKVVFLGDLCHSKSSLSESVCQSVKAFWNQNSATEFFLVQGNHDSHAGPLPTDWPIRCVGPRWQIEDVALEHFPADPPSGCSLLLCGHLHPAVHLRHGDDRLGKLPCFWLSEGTMVLPAVGEFTGTAVINPNLPDRVWVLADEQVMLHRHQVRQPGSRRRRRKSVG